MNIRILGAHSCESRDTKFVSLLVDNFLAIDAGGLTSSLSFDDQQKLKALLLTHQHYDHIRDTPALAINRFFQGGSIFIYATKSVYDTLTTHLFNDKLYPNFFRMPEPNPALNFIQVEPYKELLIEGYRVLALPVNHNHAVAYRIISPDNKELFYTGDTGQGLEECWKNISPQLLLIEVTQSNQYENDAIKSNHLTPGLLEKELVTFKQLKGYLPSVIVVHMNPKSQKNIEAELAVVSKNLKCQITVAYEGMKVTS